MLTLYPTKGAFSKNAIHCPDNRKQSVRNAWAIISGRTNWVLARAKQARARANAVVGWAERRVESVWSTGETEIREI